MKGYILIDVHTSEVFVSRNVIFHAHILTYKATNQSSYTRWSYFPPTTYKYDPIDQTELVTLNQPTTDPIILAQPDIVHNTPASPYTSLIELVSNNKTHSKLDLVAIHNTSTIDHSLVNNMPKVSTNTTLPPASNTIDQPTPSTKISSRMRHHPSYLQDYICNFLATSRQSSKVLLILCQN